MFKRKRLISYLESKLVFRTLDFKKETEVTESVMLTSDEMYSLLLSVEGMDEDLADRVVERLQGLMEGEENDTGGERL